MTTTDDHLDLYHRTTPKGARAIRENKTMLSQENTYEAFFSTHPDQHIVGYGPALVHIRVPIEWLETGWARLDDEFELDDEVWESHYAIEINRLEPQHFVD